MEIVENDAIDAATASEKKPEPVVQVKPKVAEVAKPKVEPTKPKAADTKSINLDVIQTVAAMDKAVLADDWEEVYSIFYHPNLPLATQKDVWGRLENVTKDYLREERASRTNG
jgi:hypothetical protein